MNSQDELSDGYDSFNKFANELKNDNRFFSKATYLDLFDIIIDQSTFKIDKSKELYRGRINKKGDSTPYKGLEIGMPRPDISTSNGRANPYGINYMYLSENQDTVIAELRPNIEGIISVGKFKTKQLLKVVNLKAGTGTNKIFNDKWSYLQVLGFKNSLCSYFSRPIDLDKKDLDYLPTQYFAEYCKKKKIDGIMYPSSVMETIDENNHNYVFFDDTKVEYISTEVCMVGGIKYTWYPYPFS